MPTPAFRPMSGSDIALVCRIEQDIYSHPWTPGNFTDSLNAGYSCWVAELGGQMLGYAVQMIAAGEAHLLNLSVAAAWQRNGYGQQLLQHLLEVARGHGAGIMFLEVRMSNIGAQTLYHRCGFTDYGVRKRYYPALDGREDALVMGLPLAPPPTP